MTGPLSPQPWMADALCAQVGPDPFYPTTGETVGPALAVCEKCPVTRACLDYAMATEPPAHRHGIWGGTTPNDRHAIYRHRARRTA